MASFITFLISAFWHGFYPAYYVCFSLFYLVEQSCEMLEKRYDLFEKLKRAPLPLYLFAQ